MDRWLGKLAVMGLLCTLSSACALRPGSGEASAREAQAMGNAAAATPAATSPEGAAVAAELGYHGPVRRTDARAAD